jgi:hypothetical protein
VGKIQRVGWGDVPGVGQGNGVARGVVTRVGQASGVSCGLTGIVSGGGVGSVPVGQAEGVGWSVNSGGSVGDGNGVDDGSGISRGVTDQGSRVRSRTVRENWIAC